MASLEIDGAQGEGGGQIVRTAAALAALTSRSIQVRNVRANRSTPGLRPQHVAALEAIAQACGGRFEGVKVGSERFVFRPGRLRGGHVKVRTGTAASTTLIVEALMGLAPGLPTPLTVDVGGGTDVKWSPTLEHFRSVLVPLARRLGVGVEIHEAQEGFYPKGGGRLRVLIEPAEAPAWPGMVQERGALRRVEAIARVASLEASIPERILDAFEAHLGELGVPIEREVHRVNAACPGVVVDAIARFEDAVLGVNALGEKGLPSEAVGQRLASRLQTELAGGGSVDVHAGDQLVPWMLGRVRGGYRVRDVSSHLSTNAALAERFLDGNIRFEEADAGGVDVVFASG